MTLEVSSVEHADLKLLNSASLYLKGIEETNTAKLNINFVIGLFDLCRATVQKISSAKAHFSLFCSGSVYFIKSDKAYNRGIHSLGYAKDYFFCRYRLVKPERLLITDTASACDSLCLAINHGNKLVAAYSLTECYILGKNRAVELGLAVKLKIKLLAIGRGCPFRSVKKVIREGFFEKFSELS